MFRRLLGRSFAWFLPAALVAHGAFAEERFVAPDGDDARDGTSRAAAFRTVQKGLDALHPGDVLTIAPGEYFESLARTDLGDLEHETVVRAEIPGTVVVRGDRPAPEFRPVAGRRFTYVADFRAEQPVAAVNEIDTLTILRRMPNADEPEFLPGTFHHDVAAGKLYVSTSDGRPAAAHRYGASLLPTHGLYLVRPRRVVVEGLAFTGFSALEVRHYREETGGGVWGLFLVHGTRCVVRDCCAYLNAWGIGLQSGPPGCGDNVVERCAAWGNQSAFANGDMGGITVFAARRDVVRRSTAYLNGMYGINIYGTGGAPPNYKDDGGNLPANRSLLEDCLAWGNETADLKIKTGYEYHHAARRCAAPGLWSVTNVEHGLIGRTTHLEQSTAAEHSRANAEVAGFDSRAEFADPDAHDYRLQATSRFRGRAPGGADAGPFPYESNVFFVSPAGNDSADGLSAAQAWKTFARGVRNLRPGDTLYLAAGTYDADVELRAAGRAEAPIVVRGRGTEAVQLRGAVRAGDCRSLRFERITFRDGVRLDAGRDLRFTHCRFSNEAGSPLQAAGVAGLAVSHSAFLRCGGAALRLEACSEVDLRGNLFDNEHGPAVATSSAAAIRYSDYNAVCHSEVAWQVADRRLSLAEVRPRHESASIELEPRFDVTPTTIELRNAADFAGRGPLGKPIGPYRDEPRRREMRLVAGPELHSVTATTANFEWTASLPATCRAAWGETPECERRTEFDVAGFGTFSLTGLKPGTRYYFRIVGLDTPRDLLKKFEAATAAIDSPPLSFTTLDRDAEPRTYYVATDGDDGNSGASRTAAWRTLRAAADRVRPGDTVLVAGGRYVERVRLRATGETDRPITFRALPGERVELSGDRLSLNSCFVAGGKNHLRFDGFYFAEFNLFPNDLWSLLNNGEFQLHRCRDVEIRRCFSEGRGGYTAWPVAAYDVENLAIRDCVNTYKFGGMYFWRCPNLLVENSVFAQPMITAFVLRNGKDQPSTMRNCIFTDMLDKKARLNIGLLCCDGEIAAFRHENNCYYLRDCIPLAERHLNGGATAAQLTTYVRDPLFADPRFRGDPGLTDGTKPANLHAVDRMIDARVPLDFDSFFTDDPELSRRGIGLRPESFGEFRFARPATP